MGPRAARAPGEVRCGPAPDVTKDLRARVASRLLAEPFRMSSKDIAELLSFSSRITMHSAVNAFRWGKS